MSVDHPGVLEDEALYASAIGRNQEYYLPLFRKFARGAWISWNWGAFVATLAWLQYRKINGWPLLYVFASLPFLVWWLPTDRPAACIGEGGEDMRVYIVALVALSALIVPPLVANRLYYQHVRSLVRKTPTDVAKNGGTGGYVGSLLLQAAALVLGLAAYPDMAYYVTRAQIAEGVAIMFAAAKDVQRYQRDHGGQLPAKLEDATQYHSGVYVDRIELDKDGTLRSTFNKNSKVLAGRSISLIPAGQSEGATTYRCVSENLVERCLPKQCKGR